MKICSNKKCKHKGERQCIENFSRDNKAPDSLRKWCKDCDKEKRGLRSRRTFDDKLFYANFSPI